MAMVRYDLYGNCDGYSSASGDDEAERYYATIRRGDDQVRLSSWTETDLARKVMRRVVLADTDVADFSVYWGAELWFEYLDNEFVLGEGPVSSTPAVTREVLIDFGVPLRHDCEMYPESVRIDWGEARARWRTGGFEVSRQPDAES